MRPRMSLKLRRELLQALRPDYHEASYSAKKQLLDGFIAATGYDRKYAIKLLNKAKPPTKRQKRKREFDDAFVIVLKELWIASNRICSKRLVPFLPSLVAAMEKFRHIALSEETKRLLEKISPATVDRLLKEERKKYPRARGTTKPGTLLKKHIPVRTFADWNDVEPGFFECDLVAHCGSDVSGQYLNTLTMTDIVTAWTECLALLNKTEIEVMAAICRAIQLLPFPLKGLDTDNGSEFINSSLTQWCVDNQVTFTRSREYKKNDQAHVEEKNGSIVRRFVGYDRFEGDSSKQQLSNLYEVTRLYVNYFQPTQKLLCKQRDGARTVKTYEVAQTPYQRILSMPNLSESTKASLRDEFESLDPVHLLQEIERLQTALWRTAKSPGAIAQGSLTDLLATSTVEPAQELQEHRTKLRNRQRATLGVAPKLAQGATLRQIILHQTKDLPFDHPLQTKDFLAFGTRNSIRMALFRMVKNGLLMHTSRGVFQRIPPSKQRKIEI